MFEQFKKCAWGKERDVRCGRLLSVIQYKDKWKLKWLLLTGERKRGGRKERGERGKGSSDGRSGTLPIGELTFRASQLSTQRGNYSLTRTYFTFTSHAHERNGKKKKKNNNNNNVYRFSTDGWKEWRWKGHGVLWKIERYPSLWFVDHILMQRI